MAAIDALIVRHIY